MKLIAGEIERLQMVIAGNPQSTQFARLAEYLIQANRVPEAIEICKKGLEYNTNYANGHFILGRCYFNNQDFEAAEGEFNKTLLFDSEHLQTYHFLARIMKERGWQNAYLLWLKRVLSIDPLDKLAQSLLEDYSDEEIKETEANLERDSSGDLEQGEEQGQQIEDSSEIIPGDLPEHPEEKIETAGIDQASGDEEKYEFILDDIFKDEVAEQESVESTEEDVELAVEMEDSSKQTEEIPDDILEESPVEENISTPPGETVEQFTEEQSEEETEKTFSELNEEIPYGKTEMTTMELAENEAVMEPEDSVEIEPEVEPATEDLIVQPEAEKTETEEPPEAKKTGSAQKEPFVTSTLGEIYAAQGHFTKAISVYEILLKKNPDNQFYEEKIEDLKRKQKESEQANKSD